MEGLEVSIKSALPQAIKDIHLLLIVAGLLVVDVVFLSSWIAIDPLQAEILTFKEMVRNSQYSLLTLISVRSPIKSFQIKETPSKQLLLSWHTHLMFRVFTKTH